MPSFYHILIMWIIETFVFTNKISSPTFTTRYVTKLPCLHQSVADVLSHWNSTWRLLQRFFLHFSHIFIMITAIILMSTLYSETEVFNKCIEMLFCPAKASCLHSCAFNLVPNRMAGRVTQPGGECWQSLFSLCLAPCGAGHPSSPLVHLLPHLCPLFTFLFL